MSESKARAERQQQQEAGQRVIRRAIRAVVWTGPELDPDRVLCLPGQLLWKRAAIEHYMALGVLTREETPNPAAPVEIPEDGILILPLDVGQVPALCYAEPGLRSLFPPLAVLGLMDVCWNHAGSIMYQQQSRLQQASPGLPVT